MSPTHTESKNEVQRVKSKVDGPSRLNWTVQKTETGRSKRLKVDGPKDED